MRVLSLVACFAVVAACATSHATPDAGADGGVDASVADAGPDLALLDEVIRTRCERAVRCTPVDERASMAPWECDSVWAWERDAIAAGDPGVLLDATAARACLDGLRALGDCVAHGETWPRLSDPYDSRGDLVDLCDGIITHVSFCDGAPCDGVCYVDENCAERCDPGAPYGTACGTGTGTVCAPEFPCFDGVCTQFCDVTECRRRGFDTCAGATIDDCRRFAAIGEACTLGGCNPDEGTCDAASERCVAYAGLRPGARCDPTTQPWCAANLVCDSATATCTPIGISQGSCVRSVECGEGGFCIEDPPTGLGLGHCGTTALGSRCFSFSRDYVWIDGCPDGLRCSAPIGTCGAVASEGGACGEGMTCDVGLRCSLGRCRAVVLRDGACDDDIHPCATGLTCLRGLCRADVGSLPGSPCLDTCRYGECVDGTCEELPVGAWCDSPYECRGCDGLTCRAPANVARGGACGLWSDCAAGLACRGAGSDRHCCP